MSFQHRPIVVFDGVPNSAAIGSKSGSAVRSVHSQAARNPVYGVSQDSQEQAQYGQLLFHPSY